MRWIRRIQFYIDSLYNRLLLKYKRVEYGANLVVYGKLYLKGNGKMTIGDNVIFRSGLLTNPLGGGNRMVIAVDEGSSIVIGNNVGISNSCMRATVGGGIVIEDNVLIGGDCKIYDSDFHSVSYEQRREDSDTHVISKSVTIKEGAWLGAHCIVLKGVTIGERSVVGAGAVVTKSIPADELWAGNPARFIRKLNCKKE